MVGSNASEVKNLLENTERLGKLLGRESRSVVRQVFLWHNTEIATSVLKVCLGLESLMGVSSGGTEIPHGHNRKSGQRRYSRHYTYRRPWFFRETRTVGPSSRRAAALLHYVYYVLILLDEDTAATIHIVILGFSVRLEQSALRRTDKMIRRNLLTWEEISGLEYIGLVLDLRGS